MSEFNFWPVFLWLYEIASLSIRIGTLLVLPNRHSPSVAMAWLLIIYAFPLPAFLAYLFVGSKVLPASRLKRHQQMLSHLAYVRDRVKKGEIPGTIRASKLGDSSPVGRLAEKLTYMGITEENDCEFITRSEDFIDRLAHEIDQAKKEVNLLYYIFECDETGQKIIASLIRAVERGVVCRMLVDGVGSSKLIKYGYVDRLRELGVRVEVALPVQLFRLKVARFDLRNHRKLAVIDGSLAITGSDNVIDPSYGHKDLMWIDLSVVLRGPVVRQMEMVFIEDWHVETGEILSVEHLFQPFEVDAKSGDSYIQTVPSGPSYANENYQMLTVESIIAAKEQITITSPYLIPDENLLEALNIATLKGVSVRLIVPVRIDHPVVAYAGKAYYRSLMEMGVEVWIFDDGAKGLLHSKTMTVDDDLAFVGSSNFDIRSFALNFELNMIFYSKSDIDMVREIQESYLAKSHKLSLEEWMKRPRIFTSIEGASKLLSPLL